MKVFRSIPFTPPPGYQLVQIPGRVSLHVRREGMPYTLDGIYSVRGQVVPFSPTHQDVDGICRLRLGEEVHELPAS